MRNFILLLLVPTLLIFGCNPSSRTCHVVEGVQVFALIPSQHVNKAGSEKLLVADEGELIDIRHYLRDKPGEDEIWLLFSARTTAHIGETLLNWEVVKWVIETPNNAPIQFDDPLTARTGDSIIGIHKLERSRANEIASMLVEQ